MARRSRRNAISQEDCPNCRIKTYCRLHPYSANGASSKRPTDAAATLDKLYNELVASKLQRYSQKDASEEKHSDYWQRALAQKLESQKGPLTLKRKRSSSSSSFTSTSSSSSASSSPSDSDSDFSVRQQSSRRHRRRRRSSLSVSARGASDSEDSERKKAISRRRRRSSRSDHPSQRRSKELIEERRRHRRESDQGRRYAVRKEARTGERTSSEKARQRPTGGRSSRGDDYSQQRDWKRMRVESQRSLGEIRETKAAEAAEKSSRTSDKYERVGHVSSAREKGDLEEASQISRSRSKSRRSRSRSRSRSFNTKNRDAHYVSQKKSNGRCFDGRGKPVDGSSDVTHLRDNMRASASASVSSEEGELHWGS